ncbi:MULTISPECIES: RNA polymerase sigma factor [Parabacteroides]|jgi:RNA polymerase sigma factor, sigma-70 family|uniref:RNA polymerase sigma-70 factor (ECF subfamily) n=1 Tax=Parabacteroides faecis TaxID=1217282 RepID=A0ABR6KF80_9BACT|nr:MULTISPECIES: sigma-70 family RNA polymerase sigma factor [Parabacteroides]MBB4620150.1 RNA polymerase sigma-70 factor (ECF subfamily) [Parabacteroides faecis]MBC8617859.1 sigma-70 family RNA polymerase sigma factor [Parabacteroides faecis]MCS2891022.1 sigma-70 family RNA polymerase sigma factor [Parabacteroides faecis]RHR42222.1 RNA polymerase subunit sigma-70 [Parabacteroides sp. AF18-52]RHR93753.1 RNA polymerase subunit sigma-70 [Parabacteroides sp. AF14-59]
MLEERKLLKELTEGSESSFNALYNLWGARLYRFAFSYLKSDSAAKDVVQETFVKIWTNRAGINPDTSFKAYLFTISYHFLLKELRRQLNHPQMENYLEIKKEVVSAEDVEAKYDFDLFLKELETAKQKLTPRQKEIFTLNKEYNLSITEIASRLSITEQVVRNQLSAALKVLRRELSNYSYLFILFTIYF